MSNENIQHIYFRLLGQPVATSLHNHTEGHLDSQPHLTIPNTAPSPTCSGHIHHTSGHNHQNAGHTQNSAGYSHCTVGYTHQMAGHNHHTAGHNHHPAGHTHHTAVHCRSHRGMWEVRTVSEGGGDAVGMNKNTDT